jgi:murein DD-endopeptidase MepM/ murein hydrolase activator NlpD
MKPGLVLAALLCAACASKSAAPISYGGARASRPAPTSYPPSQTGQASPPARTPSTPAAEDPGRPIPEQPFGEPDWAEGEGVPLSAFALRPEEAQPYHPARIPRTHRVGDNESLIDIAARYQIPLRALIDQNDLDPPFALTPGRELELPPPRTHRVGSGESFEDVARRFNIDARSLALLNRIQPPYQVREGDAVVLPALARDTAPPQTAIAQAPAAPGIFDWPVRGEVLARFGPQASGARLDGIEIAARAGENIQAAAAGEVVYSGSDLPAYGTLVLLRHEGDYVTAYGYARRALVREGQRVERGQAVVEAGPQNKLLFQVRRGTEAMDPLPLLGGN